MSCVYWEPKSRTRTRSRCIAAKLVAFAALVALVSLLALAGCKDGPAASTDPVVQGDELFRTACRRCHGTDGKGGPVGMLGEPPARDLTDPTFQARVSDDEIGRTIRSGRKGMPAFAAVFTPEQVNLLVARVRRFGPAPRNDR